MVLRYIHKGWKTFWTIVLTVLVVVLVVGGGLLAALQLDATKDIVAKKIENDFRKNYNGRLSIGELDGFLPFRAELKKVVLTADSVRTDTLVKIDDVQIGINIWGLLQNELSIDAFKLQKPLIRLLPDGKGSYTLSHALEKENKDTTKSLNPGNITSSWIKHVEIVAPDVSVSEGQLEVAKIYGTSDKVKIPQPLRIKNVNASMFVELTSDHRLVDINNLSARVAGLKAGKIALSGQAYNDDQYLEFNAFNFSAGSSHILVNGKIDGVDVYKGALRDQLMSADYDIDITSDGLKLSEFNDLVTTIPAIQEPLSFTLKTQGPINNLHLDTFSLGVRKSYFSINGLVKNVLKKDQLAYQFNIDTLAVRKKDVEIFTGSLNEKQYAALENLHLNGQASGNADSLNVNVSGRSPLGQFKLKGDGQLVNPYKYEGSLSGQGVNIGPLVAGNIDTTNLNFNAVISGRHTSLKSGTLQFEGSARNSMINKIRIDSLRLQTSLNNGLMEATYYYLNQQQLISGKGSADFNKQDPLVNLKGNTKNVELSSFFAHPPVDSTSINTSYEVNLQGLKPDRMQGMARFEVEPSVISGDSVQSHKIEVQLNSPELASRTLKVNSSLFDLTVTGDIKPTNISDQYTYWANYFKDHISKEIRFDSTAYVPQKTVQSVDSLRLHGDLQTKNLTLVKQYWPAFPSITTHSTMIFDVAADTADLQFSSKIQSDTLQINSISIKDAGSTLNGKFQHDKDLKQYSSLNFETHIDQFKSNFISMDSLAVNFDYEQDSVFFAQKVERFSQKSRFNLKMHSVLSDTSISVAVDSLFLGNSRYAWQNEGTPTLFYNRAKEFYFSKFHFKNQNEYIALQGRLSPDPGDSLEYIVQNVRLGRISDLVTGRLDFDGLLNGRVQTRSLTRNPSIVGKLTVDSLKLQDRLVGDASFSSTFNEAKDRFDTQLKVITDSTKYASYLKANKGIGQNMVLNGYVLPPKSQTKQDSLFYFDANFNEVDMWIIPLIAPNIFNKMEGSAKGKGYITGNFNKFDFHADFQTDHVYAKPAFLNTNYYLDGHVGLDRQKGVVLDSVKVTDNKGGKGLLWGGFDFNDFKPITFLDLNLRLDDLQFLDNSYDPDVPFYGSLAGTGTVHLKGANTDMHLTSSGPIKVSKNSTLSIPLVEETELNTNNSFIQFVDSFENPQKKKIRLSSEDVRKSNLNESALEQAIGNLTFSERFNLDLQFDAPDEIGVRLIFDPVTGEVLKADGTGRLRITMQEGDVRMFGRYNINSGNYQFVSGEIFARKLDLKPGGTIIWEGPPDDARLDIDAVYHARPSLASLSTVGTTADQNRSQRVPVDLIVEIGGTVSSVENNYYFELPQNQELTSSTTLQYRINQINQDDQQKLLQATSILFTGNFLATQTGTGPSQTSQLSSSLAKSSTLINPLLSNQIISPLLSNQINSLLNSDVTSFDVDFNLNAYNQIDLGIALRLYNDKLILRREGYLTGGRSESSFGERIGDLNATYRINNNFSLNAFHRQDQILGTLDPTNQAGDLTPSVDGVGVEAQVQYNTWHELVHKIKGLFHRIFGGGDKNDKEKSSNKKDIAEQKN